MTGHVTNNRSCHDRSCDEYVQKLGEQRHDLKKCNKETVKDLNHIPDLPASHARCLQDFYAILFVPFQIQSTQQDFVPERVDSHKCKLNDGIVDAALMLYLVYEGVLCGSFLSNQ